MQELYPASAALPSGNEARPLIWWTGAQLEAVMAPVTRTWAAWAHDWVREPHGTAETVCVQAHERPDRQGATWVALGRRGKAVAWMEVRADAQADVLGEIFGADAHAGTHPSGQQGIASSIASRAWADLGGALREMLALDPADRPDEPEAACFKPWSGAVLVSVRGSHRMPRTLLLNAECVRALLAAQGSDAAATRHSEVPRTMLTPLAQALAARKLPIRVELAPCELDLGSLQGLRVGDIIPLPHSLDAPLLVSTAQDVPVCSGFLGRHAGFKAIELVREAHADHHP